jgi:hypothetical protein
LFISRGVADRLMENKSMPTQKEMMAIALEDALNEMGEPTLEIVTNRLFQQYHCNLVDCLEHPDYLGNVLKETFGYAQIAVVEKIKKNLGELGSERPVEEFLKVIAR